MTVLYSSVWVLFHPLNAESLHMQLQILSQMWQNRTFPNPYLLHHSTGEVRHKTKLPATDSVIPSHPASFPNSDNNIWLCLCRTAPLLFLRGPS